MPLQSSRHCLEHILTRQGEVKGKRAKLRKESEGFFLTSLIIYSSKSKKVAHLIFTQNKRFLILTVRGNQNWDRPRVSRNAEIMFYMQDIKC